MSKENIEELANKLGLDKNLLQEMGIEQLSEEQINILATIFNLYANDKESFKNYLEETGLNEILNNLPNVNKKDVNDKNKLSNLIKQIEDLTNNKNLNI